MSVFHELRNRGFIKQCTDENAVLARLDRDCVTYYAGFDPTANSLHVGSLVPIMVMAHLQRAGHRPIVIIGGSTGLIGDPSGKSEMRKMLDEEVVEKNANSIRAQISQYLVLDGVKGLALNNNQWFRDLRYVAFLCDIGRYFKVNEMLRNEGYRLRMEREEGLSFIEFNYQLMQAYDFLHLFREYECTLQVGGDDQWGNILAGTNLVQKIEHENVFGLTFPLLSTSRGNKMGKTESGTVWLDKEKTSPYEFYQYWVNTEDADVLRFLKLFTFLSLDEIFELSRLEGANIRKAKEVLAYEVTVLAHGEKEASRAQKSSRVVFGSMSGESDSVPTTQIPASKISRGISVVEMSVFIGLTQSNSEARRLIKQRGLSINGQPVSSPEQVITVTDFSSENGCLIRKGKKTFHRLILMG